MAGFLRRFLTGNEPAPERRAISIGDPALAEFLGLAGRTVAGTTVNETTSVGLTAVYRAVAIIAGTIAGLPLKSYRTNSDGQREKVATFLDSPAGPGGAFTQYEWIELVMAHLLLHGNAYLQHLYNGTGAVVGLNPLPPGAVTVRPIQTATEREKYGGPFGQYRKWFTVHTADGPEVDLTCMDLTHIPALGTDGVRGLSPIEAHAQAIGVGLAGDRAAARLFGNGLLFGGLVSGDEDMSQDEAAEAVAQLKAKMAGVDHAGDITFVNARLKFTPWTIPPADAQFLETRNYQIEEVSRIFGLPPHLLGLTEKQTSWGTGVAEQNRGFARYTLMAWTTRIEQRLSALLTRPTICEFDYSGLLQPAPEVEIPLLINQVKAGLLTVNEARRIRNYSPLSAGDGEALPAPPAEGTEEAVP